VKCLVWDLDDTLWCGTLLESDACRLRPGVRAVIEELDRRGVLQSVASRNDPDQALLRLERKGLERFFLHPQIGWDSKVRGVRRIAERLDVALDSLALIDDEPFEREQVQRILPGVRTYPAEACRALPGLPEFSPAVLSPESCARRTTYRQLDARERAGRASGMSLSAFLAWCRTVLTLRQAVPSDLPRVQELLQRTHQLNSTGVVWTREDIGAWLEDRRWWVLIAELEDRFVDYGRIGVAACRRDAGAWELVAFLLSCRVLSRGIAGYILAWVRHQAALEGATTVVARYRPGPRNHLMERLFRLAGLQPQECQPDGTVLFVGPTLPEARGPRWLTVHDGGAS
jgi:methoxymalonate biosynthesis protein